VRAYTCLIFRGSLATVEARFNLREKDEARAVNAALIFSTENENVCPGVLF
jgi:hypothetical protein